ncbi:sugar phosphate nucleotidyltransferase [Gilvibacter sp.]|uniref:sugar phosphate nucleotidyltransferase n=1 Tax=Gilvibacter sp. TaxID=2729997 RepID=UPI0035BE24FC
MKTLIILAGGASSRMKSSEASANVTAAEVAAANASAKCLIVLEGDKRPVLDYLLKQAAKAGVERVVLLTGFYNAPFKQWYDDAEFNQNALRVQIDFAIQRIPEGRDKPHGTADALQQALEQLPELKEQEFLVSNSDNLYDKTTIKALLENEASNAFIAYDRAGLDFAEEKIARFALCRLGPNNELLEIVEKPQQALMHSYRDQAGTLRVSMNIFKFHGQDIYPYLVSCQQHPQRKERELPTALMNMIHQGGISLLGIPYKQHVPDLTTKEDIALFRAQLRTT